MTALPPSLESTDSRLFRWRSCTKTWCWALAGGAVAVASPSGLVDLCLHGYSADQEAQQVTSHDRTITELFGRGSPIMTNNLYAGSSHPVFLAHGVGEHANHQGFEGLTRNPVFLGWTFCIRVDHFRHVNLGRFFDRTRCIYRTWPWRIESVTYKSVVIIPVMSHD